MSTTDISPQAVDARRKDFSQRLAAHHATPLWTVLAELVPNEPRPRSVPALWRYAQMRPFLIESGGLIGTGDAMRRVLGLENPGLPGRSAITESLYAGLQLILPGEVARSHRHVASAFRFVIESEGAFTAVDGERTTMRPGDFVVTANWAWHDHGNPGEVPAVWMDGLDLPIVNFFNTSFFEDYPAETQPVGREEGDAQARYGRNLLPVDYSPGSQSPVFNYPYERTREALDKLAGGPLDPCHGIKLRYINPATGGFSQPAHGAFIQFLPPGFSSSKYRSTDGTVYCVAEGRGWSQVGDERFDWAEHDIFVVPPWCPVSHGTGPGAVVFSFSDRPAQQSLGLWREQRLEA